jgi:hypothetical protein
MYKKGAQLKSKIQNGNSTTVMPPVLSPSSILPPLSFYSAFIPAKKNSAHFKKCYYIRFFTFSKLRNSKIT